MKTIMTDQGLLIPSEELAQWGEVVIEEQPYQLIIRPKSVTQLLYGSIKVDPDWVDRILEDVETGGAVIDDGEPPAGLHIQ